MTSHTVRLVLRSGVILEQTLNETDFRELEDQFVARVRAHSQELCSCSATASAW